MHLTDWSTAFGRPVVPPLNLITWTSLPARVTAVGAWPPWRSIRPRTEYVAAPAPFVLPRTIGADVGEKLPAHDSSATMIAGWVAAIIASSSVRPFRGFNGTQTLPAA